MNNKKKIIAICVCVALLAGTILSGTIAYFTDKEAITNTFTSGNVMIDLDETCTNSEGQTITEFNEVNLYPGDEFTKKPVITVGKGDQSSEDAYVAAKIEIKAGDLTKTDKGDYTQADVFTPDLVVGGKLDIKQLLTGGLLAVDGDPKAFTKITEVADAAAAKAFLEVDKEDTYVMFQTFTPVSEGSKEGTYTFYVYANAIKADGAEIELFNKLSIPDQWDNAEMDEFKDFDITVKAFATQEKHLGNCYNAMASAFSTDFPA